MYCRALKNVQMPLRRAARAAYSQICAPFGIVQITCGLNISAVRELYSPANQVRCSRKFASPAFGTESFPGRFGRCTRRLKICSARAELFGTHNSFRANELKVAAKPTPK